METNVKYGPHSWRENRNHEGLTMTLDIVLEGYVVGDDEVKITKEFNWIIPDEHKTTAYWHPSGGTHPITGDSVHNEFNDTNYKAAYMEWQKLIEVSEPYNILSSDMHAYLETLQEPVMHENPNYIITPSNPDTGNGKNEDSVDEEESPPVAM
jgi:hypothetical protein|tara:strand:- start:237 stop:695 length:459 start_codon:yes stop_codon:yes gene_type:complete